MRAGLLHRALARLGPVKTVVVPVYGSVGHEAGEDMGDDDLTVVAIDNAVASVAGIVGHAERVVVMREYLAPFLDTVLHRDGRPVCVLDVDDIESSTRRQFGDREGAEPYEALERHYLPQFDHVLVCSEDDARQLRDRFGVRALLVPNAVDVPARTGSVPARWDLLFVANLSYEPNVEAARWLCADVLPHLEGTRAALVGLDPVPEVVALGSDDVFVSGTVPDVAPYYAASRVVVVPLHAGGGTSIKVLEAFAHRRPVVATTVGGRGLPTRHGEQLLVADDAAAFAAACRQVLDDPGLADRLADAGAALVHQRFTIDHVSGFLAGALNQPESRSAGDR